MFAFAQITLLSTVFASLASLATAAPLAKVQRRGEAACTYSYTATTPVPAGTDLPSDFLEIIVAELFRSGTVSSVGHSEPVITNQDATRTKFTVEQSFFNEQTSDTSLQTFLTGLRGKTLVSQLTELSYTVDAVTCGASSPAAAPRDAKIQRRAPIQRRGEAKCTYGYIATSPVPNDTDLPSDFVEIILAELFRSGTVNSVGHTEPVITSQNDGRTRFTVEQSFFDEQTSDAALKTFLAGLQGKTLTSQLSSLSYVVDSVTCDAN